MAAATSALAGVVVVSVVFLAASEEAGLKCYSCYMEKKMSKSCGDPFSLRSNQQYKVDCVKALDRQDNSSGYYFCQKVKQLKDGSPIVTRLCAWAQNESTVCDSLPAGSEDLKLKLLHCSTCRTDGCNGSSAVLPTVALVAAVLLLLFWGA